MNDRSMTALGALAALAMAAAPEELSYDALKTRLRGVVARDPMDATLATVLVGSFLFYRAEKGHNPKVETFSDALVFISTCLSVGYADVFARTDAGKAIASAVMTFGPAMSAAILEPPKDERDAAAALEAAPAIAAQNAVVDKLTAILDELRLQSSHRA